VKEFPDYRSVYSAAPNLPAMVLRGIARYAGAHIYNDQGDTLYATPNLLAVHTAAGGKRVFTLPGTVEMVYDLFSKQVIVEKASRFEVQLEPASTLIYFTGDSKQLETLAG
jgi:hypothetical protein